jgi:DNA recombination protein RmuC
MTLNFLVAVLLLVISALTTYLLTRWQARAEAGSLREELVSARAEVVSVKTDYDARQQELRDAINDARKREGEANEKAAESDRRHEKAVAELKVALEEKGKFQNEATRVEETKTALAARDTTIHGLNGQITTLTREKGEAVRDADAANKRADEMVAKEREAQGAIIRAKDEQIAKLSEFIALAKEALTNEFKAVSADTLRDVSAQLIKTADGLIEKHGEKTTADVKLHQQHIEKMLLPVEETMKRLDKHVEDNAAARLKAETLLNEQVQRLSGASESLTNALRKPVVRGSWGEMTLENALENAGLEAEIDFVLQHTTEAEDGQKRTDALISLPKGRKLVIDSKNLMASYIPLASTEDEAQRAILAEAHGKSLRKHMKDLSGKEYWGRYEGLDCVILFIPHDGMYHAAIRDEADLIREACDKRVFIANPMSLIPLLKAIRYVLDQDRLNKSAQEISKVGTELYGEVTRFAESMATIGNLQSPRITRLFQALIASSSPNHGHSNSLGRERELKQSYLKPSKLSLSSFPRGNYEALTSC